LQKAAKISPEWGALVREWDLLEKMHNEKDGNLFKQMQKIIKGAAEA
jgi:hypothetical protein